VSALPNHIFAVSRETTRNSENNAMLVNTTNAILLPSMFFSASLLNAESYVCQIMIRRDTDPSFETLYLVQTVFVGPGKMFWTI
jgi:hypothetical protein